jgi:CubicO group peptidase (beta-lactamase class C family)
VGVLTGDRAAYLARGRVHRDRPDPPSLDTLFEIGSITKTFTAAALSLLALEASVALDDPVQRYLPAAAKLSVRGRPITLVDLVAHSSGLPRLHPGMLRHALRHRADPYSDITVSDLYAALPHARPRAAPGKKWRYSNFGFALLGNALAAHAGVSYEELVCRRLCAPLALFDTCVTVAGERASRFAQGHDRRGRPVPHWDLSAYAGAGALRSTAVDMLGYLSAQLAADGRSRAAGSPAAASPADASPPAALPADASPVAGGESSHGTRLHTALRLTHEPHFCRRRISMGLGWIVLPQRRRPYPVIFHNGGTGGFRSFAGFVPQTQTAVVVLANDSRDVDRLGMQLTAALQDALPPV